MAKIHPHQAPSFYPQLSSQRENFTIWMKSLVFHTNGCTIYNSKGQIVFRVDNYEEKCSDEVHLMDGKGKVLCTIRKKGLRPFGGWNGYRSSCSNLKKEKPWFQVKRYCRALMGNNLACQVSVGRDKYRIIRLEGKLAGFRIINLDGNIIAEAKQKLSSSGVVLGDDVLTLEVESNEDHSLIMALVTVYGLSRRKM
ncbi:hypothetical protein UlMin_001894 [Ulmus minor]